jgi:hypothetical protein
VLVILVVDPTGLAASARFDVVVRDTTPPEMETTASPEVLWPPNHRLETVHVSIRVHDSCAPDLQVVLAAATSSEPEDAPGGEDGRTAPDIAGAGIGTDDREVLLRAERDEDGDGRTYTLTYSVRDPSGNAGVANVEIRVPRSRSEE